MTPTELRELDAWIAEHVLGYTYSNHNLCCKKTGRFIQAGLPYYSSDPAAAMEVLKKCIAVIEDVHFGWHLERRCYFVWGDGEKEFAETLELSICLFAKKLFTK